jgi:exosortase/archaeosortase family protein
LARPGDVRHARLRFAATFAVVAGAALAIYSFPYAEHGVREDWFTRYLAAYARVAGWVLRLTHANVQVAGTEVVGNISLTVAKNCDAMDVNILFVAAIVAFPVGWRRRAIGIGLGVAGLAIANIVRIVSLYYIGVRWPSRFEVVHAELWPFAMVALAVSAFLLWSRWATTAEARPAEADAAT